MLLLTLAIGAALSLPQPVQALIASGEVDKRSTTTLFTFSSVDLPSTIAQASTSDRQTETNQLLQRGIQQLNFQAYTLGLVQQLRHGGAL